MSNSNLTKAQLRRIYTMRQLRWSNNVAITVFVLPSQHVLHQRFAKEQLQMFPYQLNRIWHKLTYSGLGVAPTIVKSEQELLQAVIKTPGAIGYLTTDTLKGISPDKVMMVSRDYKVIAMEDEQKISVKGVANIVKTKD